MDNRLERLKSNLLNSWFPTHIEMFENEDATDLDELMTIFFIDLLDLYRTAFPSLMGRVYSNYNSTDPLFLQDIDDHILRLLGVSLSTAQLIDTIYDSSSISGRSYTIRDSSVSNYMSEQAAIDLYAHIIVDEWSGRMDKPLIMWDNTSEREYVIPNMGDFLVFYIKERSIDVNNIPSSLYPSVESFLTYHLAEYVLGALGRYPLTLAMTDLASDQNSNTALDPHDISSITIDGKLTLSLTNSSSENYEKLSNLFGSGSGSDYIEQLRSIRDSSKKIFEALKYMRLGGISVI